MKAYGEKRNKVSYGHYNSGNGTRRNRLNQAARNADRDRKKAARRRPIGD